MIAIEELKVLGPGVMVEVAALGWQGVAFMLLSIPAARALPMRTQPSTLSIPRQPRHWGQQTSLEGRIVSQPH